MDHSLYIILKYLSIVRTKKAALFSITLFLLLGSCQTASTPPEMSIEEARDVVMEMQNVPLEPPPRQIDDILSMLGSRGKVTDAWFTRLVGKAIAEVPEEKNLQYLGDFFKTRGDARYQLNRFNEAAKDYRQALGLIEKTKTSDSSLYFRLAELELRSGRYDAALEFSNQALNDANTGWRKGPYRAQKSLIYHRMGHALRARFYIDSAKTAYDEIPKWALHSNVYYAGDMDMGTRGDIHAVEAEILESQGRYAEAHPMRAGALNIQLQMRRKKPLGQVYAHIDVAANLMNQGRLVSAEKEARSAIQAAVSISGNRSSITADALQSLGEILLHKGELGHAKKLSARQERILDDLQLDPTEEVQVRGNLFRAVVLGADYNFAGAMEAYDKALSGMRQSPYYFQRYAHRNPGLILSLIQSKRLPEAEQFIVRTRGMGRFFASSDSYENAELEALMAIIEMTRGQTAPALSRMKKAAPPLSAAVQDPSVRFDSRRRAQFLLQAYIDFLLNIRAEQDLGVPMNVADEIFRLLGAQTSRTNSALGESSARAASLTNPELAELVRQAQDIRRKIQSLKALLHNATAAAGDASKGKLHQLERSIASLGEARQAILARIDKEFPRYNDYVQPKSPRIAEIQALLTAKEAFVGIWTLKDKTLVWAIPHQGPPLFHVVHMGKQALQQKVTWLRRALAPDARWISQIPPFDLETAHALYRSLLAPVATAWKPASELLVVVKGPMDQIPLAILPVEPVSGVRKSSIKFDGYSDVPWLIRKAAISRLPSAASLRTLRRLPQGDARREAFAGFGDPIFNADLEGDAVSIVRRQATDPSGDRPVQVRGLRLSEKGRLDNQAIASVRIENLKPLPDTADEVRDIARILGADPATDVFVGTDATETRVKKEPLYKKQILVFATHALLPGDLDGLVQPALAFTSPDVAIQSDEDGLLTLGEVLGLRLDADLVVLSACDTGAGDGLGSEAISGLGRAFFYAGARSLLATMWPVETTSARKLTTATFEHRTAMPSASWSQCLRESVFELMKRGFVDADGRMLARYAHPLFWAPFVVIGGGSSPS